MFDFKEATAKNTEIVDQFVKTFSVMTNGLQAIATEATDFSKKAAENGVAHFEKLMSVNSLEAAAELQSSYVKSSYDLAVSQASKMTDLFADLAKVSAVSSAVEPVKAAKTAVPKAAAAKVSRSAANVKSGLAA
jgi:hypothetical protein